MILTSLATTEIPPASNTTCNNDNNVLITTLTQTTTTPAATTMATMTTTATTMATMTTTTATSGGLAALRADHEGAMLFIIATVCVYGMSIVFFIAGHISGRQENKDEEKQISRYLKRVHVMAPERVDRKYLVLRFKSRLLTNSALGQRHDRRTTLLPKPMSSTLRTLHGGDGNDVRDRMDRNLLGRQVMHCEYQHEGTASHDGEMDKRVRLNYREQNPQSPCPPTAQRSRRLALCSSEQLSEYNADPDDHGFSEHPPLSGEGFPASESMPSFQGRIGDHLLLSGKDFPESEPISSFQRRIDDHCRISDKTFPASYSISSFQEHTDDRGRVSDEDFSAADSVSSFRGCNRDHLLLSDEDFPESESISDFQARISDHLVLSNKSDSISSFQGRISDHLLLSDQYVSASDSISSFRGLIDDHGRFSDEDFHVTASTHSSQGRPGFFQITDRAQDTRLIRENERMGILENREISCGGEDEKTCLVCACDTTLSEENKQSFMLENGGRACDCMNARICYGSARGSPPGEDCVKFVNEMPAAPPLKTNSRRHCVVDAGCSGGVGENPARHHNEGPQGLPSKMNSRPHGIDCCVDVRGAPTRHQERTITPSFEDTQQT